jgi:hypothetical protein
MTCRCGKPKHSQHGGTRYCADCRVAAERAAKARANRRSSQRLWQKQKRTFAVAAQTLVAWKRGRLNGEWGRLGQTNPLASPPALIVAKAGMGKTFPHRRIGL